MGRQLNCKNSLIVIGKILRLFVHTFGALDKYSLPNREFLMQPIQVKLSQKHKNFPRFFSAFSKSKLNFGHFQKKHDPQSSFISDSTACEKRD